MSVRTAADFKKAREYRGRLLSRNTVDAAQRRFAVQRSNRTVMPCFLALIDFAAAQQFAFRRRQFLRGVDIRESRFAARPIEFGKAVLAGKSFDPALTFLEKGAA